VRAADTLKRELQQRRYMSPRRGWRFIGSGFYKDFAPDGAVLQTRFNLLRSHLTPFAGEFIFSGVKPALHKQTSIPSANMLGC